MLSSTGPLLEFGTCPHAQGRRYTYLRRLVWIRLGVGVLASLTTPIKRILFRHVHCHIRHAGGTIVRLPRLVLNAKLSPFATAATLVPFGVHWADRDRLGVCLTMQQIVHDASSLGLRLFDVGSLQAGGLGIDQRILALVGGLR